MDRRENVDEQEQNEMYPFHRGESFQSWLPGPYQMAPELPETLNIFFSRFDLEAVRVVYIESRPETPLSALEMGCETCSSTDSGSAAE